MSRGWYYEGWRHSLAAKGIATRRNFALFKRNPNVKPTEVFQDPKHKYGDGDRMRLTAIEDTRHNIEMKGNSLVARGKLKYEDLERFIQQDFGVLKDQFLHGRITFEQFSEEAKKKFDDFSKIHSRTLGGFLSAPSEPQGPGLFDFEGQVKGRRSMALKKKRFYLSGGLYEKSLGKGEQIRFDPEQLAMGKKVEMEHTNNPKVAEEITKDHLTEFPSKEYYTELELMERKLRARK